MTHDGLLEHLERLIEAPDALPLLRRLVLDLAVRGRLIAQDPQDEPAAQLLRRLRATPAADVPFQIPPSWAWVRLEDVSESRLGKMLDAAKNRGTPRRYLRNVNVRWYGFDLSDVGEMRFAENELDEFALHAGDVLVCEGGEPGRAAVWDEREHDIYFQKAIHRVRFPRGFAPTYFVHVIRAASLDGRLADYFTGVTIRHLTGKSLAAVLVPLPPLAEQHRIVAKVDELMALCDRLEAAKGRREQAQDRLVAASLHRLNERATAEDAGSSDALREAARFVLNHMPHLTKRPEHVARLQDTVVSLAIRGLLVPQDPSDEPGSKLLKQIDAHKARLVKEGRLAPAKPPTPGSSEEVGFTLPPGWAPAKISQLLVELQTGPFGSSLHQSDYQKGGTPVINPASMKDGRLVPVEGMAVGPETLARLATFKLRTGDVVMARRGEMGRCAIVSEREEGWLCGTGSLILRLPPWLFPRFMTTLIGSPLVRAYLDRSAVGATMQNLNQSILLDLVVGLPPLAEQRRIVARVDELTALCHGLQAGIRAATDSSGRLLDALAREALASSEARILEAVR